MTVIDTAESGHQTQRARTDAGREFEAFLRQVLPEGWVSAVDAELWNVVEQHKARAGDEIIRVVAAEGWFTPDWPADHGGRELDGEAAADVKALMRRWNVGDVRTAIGTAWLGPTLMEWGTQDQRDRYLRKIARAEELWCQLFSEPDAGSDLASLRTAAEQRPDGSWEINGTKMWTSRADISRRGLLITRSDVDAPKHRGMTAFCLDLSLPGVTVRPIRQMTGDSEFFEVVLDAVVVSDEDRLGPRGSGWQVCKTALSFERVAGSGVGAAPPGSVVGRSIEELLKHVGGTLDSVRRDSLTKVLIQDRVIAMSNRRVSARRAAGLPIGPEGSVTKVLQAEHTKRLQRLFVDLEGAAGIAWDDDDPWTTYNVWAFLRVQAKTIAGGTSEVLRNQLAERVLGLPRDEDPSRSMPWRESLRQRAERRTNG